VVPPRHGHYSSLGWFKGDDGVDGNPFMLFADEASPNHQVVGTIRARLEEDI